MIIDKVNHFLNLYSELIQKACFKNSKRRYIFKINVLKILYQFFLKIIHY